MICGLGFVRMAAKRKIEELKVNGQQGRVDREDDSTTEGAGGMDLGTKGAETRAQRTLSIG